MNEDLGVYTELTERRVALAERLSPAARHAAFPKLYAKPVALPPPPERMQREITKLTAENQRLAATIADLKADIADLKIRQRAIPGDAEPRLIIPGDAVGKIIAACAAAWDVTIEDLLGPLQTRKLCFPRHAAYKLMREELQFSWTRIGRAAGKRDHTSAMSGARTAAHLYETDAEWRSKFDSVKAALASA